MTENAYTKNGTRYRNAYDRNGKRFPRHVPATLDEAGETLLASAKSLIESYDPNGTCIKIGFITDLHRTHEGATYAGSIVDDRYSIRLLSRLCDEFPFDAVICGGDIVNATDTNVDYIRPNMEEVVADFDDYFPFTNVFATFGNHDKRYRTTRPNNTNAWLFNLYDHLQQDGDGVELHYIEGRENKTNFYVDFPKHKLRLLFIHQYDAVDTNSDWYANENITTAVTGLHTHCTNLWKDALPTTDKADWVAGVVYHGADNSTPTSPKLSSFNYADLKDTLKSYTDNGGKGCLGALAGHWHIQQAAMLSLQLNVCHVARAYALSSEFETADAYCFSVFIINSKTGVWHELCIGRGATEIPFCVYPDTRNNGLLQNGAVNVNSYNNNFLVYAGNHVRFDRRWNVVCNGINFTNLAANSSGYYSADHVTGDTSNTLFSVAVGDVLKTEVKFLNNSKGSSRTFKIFSPQLDLLTSAYNTPAAGNTLTNEITISTAANITAIGLSYGGQTTDANGIMDFELNIYKNGVKLIRSTS